MVLTSPSFRAKRAKGNHLSLKKLFLFLRLGEVFSAKEKRIEVKISKFDPSPLTTKTLKDPKWLIAEKLPNNNEERRYFMFCKDNFRVTVGSYQQLQRQIGRKIQHGVIVNTQTCSWVEVTEILSWDTYIFFYLFDETLHPHLFRYFMYIVQRTCKYLPKT